MLLLAFFNHFGFCAAIDHSMWQCCDAIDHTLRAPQVYECNHFTPNNLYIKKYSNYSKIYEIVLVTGII